MANEWLGVKLDQIRLFQGDTDTVLFGRGTFSQRSMLAGGSALKNAADEVVRKGKRVAGWMLEAAESDIDFERGEFRVKGTDRMVSFREIARKAYQGVGLPVELGVGLDGAGSHPGPPTFPNGCMICEVEVDTDTGAVEVVRVSSVDDAGVIINPLTFEGQLHGSTAQGLGEALLEQMLYARDTGQLITGSFTDYAMPRADNMPSIASAVHPVPTKSNPLGVKGGSEAGNMGAPAAIINAIIDALSPFGVRDIDMPATPERVWRAIHHSTKSD
jgi:carbon-monoxide dehydrogenase large subunit